MNSVKDIIKLLFESAKHHGLAILTSGQEKIIVISEKYLPFYEHYQEFLDMRKWKIKEEFCFLLILETKDGIKPGYLFYDDGIVTFEDNWIEENCYWEDTIRHHIRRLARQKDARIYIRKDS